MIGSGLKKLAKENNMKVAHGVAYGSLRGYAATLSEENGCKRIVFTTRFPDPAKKDALSALIGQTELKRQYKVQNLEILPRSVQITFVDNSGALKKVRSFLDWFVPLLAQHSATPADVCTECGSQITGGRWILVNGTSHYLHDTCANRVAQEIEAEKAQKAEEDTGSYALGLLGALCGSALGAVLWAIVLNIGYVASVVGLVIGWLAEKGYNLLHGKQGRAKVAILIVAVIFGVLLGTITADVFTIIGMMNDGDLYGFTYGDILPLIFFLLAGDADYRGAVVANVLMGLLFAGLGVFAMLRKTGRDVSGTQLIDLE